MRNVIIVLSFSRYKKYWKAPERASALGFYQPNIEQATTYTLDEALEVFKQLAMEAATWGTINRKNNTLGLKFLS